MNGGAVRRLLHNFIKQIKGDETTLQIVIIIKPQPS